MAIEVKIKDEYATSSEPASIEIFEDGKLVKKIIAEVKKGKGGDGGQYPVVKFREI